MRVEPILLKEFDYEAVSVKKRSSPLLPGGRTGGEVPPPPPTFSEEQLKNAEKEAYKKGFLEGTEEGKRQQKDAEADTQEALRQTLLNVCMHFTPIVEDYKRTMLHLRTDMPKVALAAARKAAGKALDDNAAATLNDTVQRCLATISDEPEITVIIHDSMAEALEKHLQTLAKQYPVAARVRVSGQSDIPASDCRISWKDGAFLRDTNQIWQNIGQAVEQIGAGEHFAAGQELEALPQTAQPVETKPQPPASTDTAPVAQDQPPSEE